MQFQITQSLFLFALKNRNFLTESIQFNTHFLAQKNIIENTNFNHGSLSKTS
jgi:hypothetical protein